MLLPPRPLVDRPRYKKKCSTYQLTDLFTKDYGPPYSQSIRMLHIFTTTTEISPHLHIPSRLCTGVMDHQLGRKMHETHSYSPDMDLFWIRQPHTELVTNPSTNLYARVEKSFAQASDSFSFLFPGPCAGLSVLFLSLSLGACGRIHDSGSFVIHRRRTKLDLRWSILLVFYVYIRLQKQVSIHTCMDFSFVMRCVLPYHSQGFLLTRRVPP